MLDRWSALLTRRPRAVLAAGLLLTVLAAAFGAGVFGSLSQGGFDDPGSESARELVAERAALGNRGVDVVAVYGSDETTAADPSFRASVAQVLADLPAGTTTAVVPYWADRSLVSADGHHAQVLISLAGSTQNDYLRAYDALRPHLDAAGLTTQVAGAFAVYHDVNVRTSADLERAELITMPIVVLLALLIFRSVVAALLPALVGAVAMVGALAVVRLITSVAAVSVFSVNVISLLGIGLAIDYALFVVSRFREELPGSPDVPTAVRRTMATAGRTVLFSALTVAAAMSSLLIFPQTFLKSMGYGGMAAVVVAMLAALTVLPAVLLLLGRRVDAGRLPRLRGRRAPAGGAAHPVAPEGAGWERLARGVMRRPVAVIAVTLVVLGAVASPFLGVRWGSVDYRVLPDDSPAHVAAQTLLTEFGPETSTASLLLRGTDAADVRRVEQAASGIDGVVAVQRVATSDADGGTTLLRATWTGNSQTERSQTIVRELRALDPPSGSLLVGGLSADTVDLLASVGSHLPWMGLIVAVVMLLLLFLAFGSVVLPVKAVVMNLVSITASFGVVTWVFSDGHGADLLGFTPQGFVDATNPILMLAILFGLSMDYEVFLLSRVREEWDRTGDNAAAVAAGVRHTGRIITSAALLLGVVIGAFSTSGIVFMKMLGVGMLVALAIDATVVRALLVPATMALLGRWNWWAPAPLARWWQRHGFREGGAPADRATGSASGSAPGETGVTVPPAVTGA